MDFRDTYFNEKSCTEWRTSRGLSVRGIWVAPVASAFVAKLFSKSFGATPTEKPAPERSTPDLGLKPSHSKRSLRSVAKRIKLKSTHLIY